MFALESQECGIRFTLNLCSFVQKALELMHVVPKKANNMMNVGMLEGYTVSCCFTQENFEPYSQFLNNSIFISSQGKITAQGNLVLQVSLFLKCLSNSIETS